jgi:hypothetical protein
VPYALPPTVAAILLTAFLGMMEARGAATHDGNWSVLVITEKGACDQAFRYNVAVANGQVRYRGDTSVRFDGSVESGGAVKVNIRVGDDEASGTGRLTANSGAGTWRSAGKGAVCAGRWEAERR